MDTPQKPIGTPKPHDDYFLAWILRIAAAASTEISEATQLIYLEKLRHLTANEIAMAGDRTISEWAEPSKMPPLPFILERTHEQPEVIRERRDILDREDKPAEWRSFADERALGGKVPREITQEQVKNWLEGGKAAQRRHIASLESDPKWRAMAGQLGAFPGLSAKLPKTTVPADPAERKTWATKRAEAEGWR